MRFPPVSFRTTDLAFGIAYGGAAALSIMVGRIDSGVAFLWFATALLIARLTTASRRRWPMIVGVSAIGSALASGLIGVGWVAAGPLAVVNTGEAVLSALLLRRLTGEGDPLKSLAWMVQFVVAVGLVGPIVGASGAAATMAWAVGYEPSATAVRWFIGHSLGAITFTPVLLLGFAMKWRQWRRWDAPKTLEGMLLIGVVLSVTLFVFMNSDVPLLFAPILPIILATFRVGRIAAALSVVVVAIVGGIFTARGFGPVALIDAGTGVRLQFFQFYLATTVLTVLPIAADLANRRRVFRELRESEARYRLVTDHSTDVVLNVDLGGRIRFASPSITALAGLRPEEMVGREALDLVDPEHRGEVAQAHIAALATPSQTFTVEYMVPLPSGERRWFETNTRAVIDDDGHATGVVSAIRDISNRKEVEDRLSAAALTDVLTALPNRRAFFAAFERRLAAGEPGCVAMLDLDHFKRVNDRHGHAAGDAVLRRFAEIASGRLRDGDMLARLGGEEFGVLLPGAGPEQARAVLDRIREAMSVARIEFDGVACLVTLSGGVARYTGDSAPAVAMRAADLALYRAKADGRDRLAIAA